MPSDMPSHTSRPLRPRLIAAAAVAFLAAAPAAAQTVLSPVPADPATLRLQERVEQLERQVAGQTSEIERLAFELSRQREDAQRLGRSLDDLLARTSGLAAAGPAGGSPFTESVPAPNTPTSASPGAAAAPRLDRDAAFRGARELLLDNDYQGAERAFRAYLDDFGDAENAAEARYWLGQTLLGQEKFSEAAKQFLDLVQKNPKSERAPDAFVRLGTSLQRIGRTKEACLTFRDLPTRFPRAPQGVKEMATREARAAGCGA